MSRVASKLMNATSALNNAVTAPSAADLQRAFETATAQVYPIGKNVNPFRLPISFRSKQIVPGDRVAEERALTDAARALARLWHVAPGIAR